jgi:hypothetical protein
VATFAVYPLAPITGPYGACLGATTTLTNSVPGGTWTSGAPGVAAIGSSSGIVSGLALGTAKLTYTLPTGCSTTRNITVNPAPVAITGSGSVCQGYTTSLSCATPGGSWSSNISSIASVGSLSGLVSGVSPGTAVIAYVLSTGCLSTAIVTVNPLQPITGSANTCAGNSTLLANAIPGGTWSSSITSVATIDPVSGLLNPLAAGTTIVSYSLSTGCRATVVVTVNPLPLLFSVTGGGNICTGGSGLPVGVNSSETGTSYQLFRGLSHISTLAGTGTPLSFGIFSIPGTYYVRAINMTSGCARNMLDSAIIAIVPFVAPSVSVTTGAGDTACLGASTIFAPVPVHGGATPSYQWKVNGISVGSGPVYTYVPTHGDIVYCKMTSSAACVSPDTASGSITVNVIPMVLPVITASAAPGTTVCQFTPVTLTTSSTYGGTAPAYSWIKNGAYVGSGPAYSFTPSDGDIVLCKMASNRLCRVVDTVSTASHVFSVTPYVVPSVTITANPGLTITAGQWDTLIATAVNAGPAPQYQWAIKGSAVPGATSSVFVSNSFANKDSVSCSVTSSGVCSGIVGSGHVFITIDNVGIRSLHQGDLVLSPNPNAGSFTVTGTMPSMTNDINFEITNMLGQTVYTRSVKHSGNKIKELFNMDTQLSNGMYMLNMNTSNENYIFHFIISR